MKIEARGSGGFAGIVQQRTVDTALSPAGPALEAAVRDSGFFDAPSGPEPAGADLMRWQITAEQDGRRHTISFSDGSPDAARWQPLLSLILAA